MSTIESLHELNLGAPLGCPAEASAASRSRTAQRGTALPDLFLLAPSLNFNLSSRL